MALDVPQKETSAAKTGGLPHTVSVQRILRGNSFTHHLFSLRFGSVVLISLHSIASSEVAELRTGNSFTELVSCLSDRVAIASAIIIHTVLAMDSTSDR